jgi:hypothetical protein
MLNQPPSLQISEACVVRLLGLPSQLKSFSLPPSSPSVLQCLIADQKPAFRLLPSQSFSQSVGTLTHNSGGQEKPRSMPVDHDNSRAWPHAATPYALKALQARACSHPNILVLSISRRCRSHVAWRVSAWGSHTLSLSHFCSFIYRVCYILFESLPLSQPVCEFCCCLHPIDLSCPSDHRRPPLSFQALVLAYPRPLAGLSFPFRLWSHRSFNPG